MTKFTPRGYPVPDDYQQPADVPAALDDLATAVDSDLTTVEGRNVLAGNGLQGGGDGTQDRLLWVGQGTGITVATDTVAVDTNVIATRAYADSANPVRRAGPFVAPWTNVDAVVSVVEPAWQDIWPGIELAAQPEAGAWLIEAHAYVESTGGTSGPQGMLFGINVQNIPSGSFPDWAGEGAAHLGRLTVPAQTRVVTSVVAAGWITNTPGQQIRMWPLAQLLGSQVAGATVRVQKCRMTATFHRGVTTINGTPF